MLAEQVYTSSSGIPMDSLMIEQFSSPCCVCVIVEVWWAHACDASFPLAISPLAR